MGLAGRAGGALEVRHFGFSVLQFLVSQRWREVGVQERQQLATTALQLLKSVATEGAAAVPYAVRSKAAVLVADLAQVEGEGALRWLMPEVFQLGEGGGPPGPRRPRSYYGGCRRRQRAAVRCRRTGAAVSWARFWRCFRRFCPSCTGS